MVEIDLRPDELRLTGCRTERRVDECTDDGCGTSKERLRRATVEASETMVGDQVTVGRAQA